MANTTNGIYYPDEYNAIADIPKDIKTLAESVDIVIENVEAKQNTKIVDLLIKNEQQNVEIQELNNKNTFQDESLEKIETKNEQQDTEIQSLKEETTLQATEIQILQEQNTQQTTEITQLKSENTLLKSQIPSATVVGDTIHIEDSSNMQCYITPLGASKQDTREGYNKFNYESRFYGSEAEKNVVVELNENVLTATGPSNSTARFWIGGLTIGEIYSFVYRNSTFVSIQIIQSNANKEWLTEISKITTSEGYYQFTAETEAVIISMNHSSNLSSTISAAMVIEGAYTNENVPAYQQYGAMPSIEFESPIESVGDNINEFDTNILASQKVNEVNLQVLKSGIYKLSGTGPAEFATDFVVPQNWIGKTLTLSVNNIFEGNIGFKNKTIGDIVVIKTSTTRTFEMTEEIANRINKFSIYINSNFNGEIELSFKVQKGSKATPYSPYLQGSIGITIGDATTSETKALYTQQPLRSIGDVKDRFVKADRVWYESHPVYRYVFTGTENWKAKTNGKGLTYFYLSVPKASSYALLSNRFPRHGASYDSFWNDTDRSDKLSFSSSLDIINILTEKEMTLEEFKAMLVGTPVYVDYILAEPTLIECTTEQVEILESFNTYKNVTNISSDSIGELEVFYYQDLVIYINNAIDGQVNQAVGGEY